MNKILAISAVAFVAVVMGISAVAPAYAGAPNVNDNAKNCDKGDGDNNHDNRNNDKNNRDDKPRKNCDAGPPEEERPGDA